MIFDLDAAQGEWFQFFGSHLDPSTGETIFEEPIKDARVQIRSMIPFFEERLKLRKKSIEHVYNPKTRAMERISYIPDLSIEDAKAERDDAYDYCITAIENFKDSKTGAVILCTRENKLKLMRIPVFDRFLARCLQLLASSGVKEKEDEIKKLLEVAEWQAEYLPTCVACKEMYGGRNPPQEPPCEVCIPEFREENKDALMVYSIIRNQFIMGSGGPVDINHLTIWKTIEKYGIKNQQETFEKVLRLANWNLNKILEKKDL